MLGSGNLKVDTFLKGVIFMTYTMKQFVEMFSTSEFTVRYYTDIGILPYKRSNGNHRIFDDESVNWMHGINCLKKCGATINDIKEYCRLCKLPESEETLKTRRDIILKLREGAYSLLDEAQSIVDFMENSVKHYEDALSGKSPDGATMQRWPESSQPAKF